MMGPSTRARWCGLVAIVGLAVISGGWLLRRKAAPEGSVYQQARLFENVDVAPAGFECVRLVSSPAAAHFSYVRMPRA